MIQATMQEWVRKRLHDNGVKQRHSDGLITSALSMGAMKVQGEVIRYAPEAFNRIYYRTIQAGDNRYQHPRGMLRVRNLHLIYDASTGFRKADVATSITDIDDPLSDLNQSGSSTPQFSVAGGEIRIWPTPTQDIEDGFKLSYVPALGFTNLTDDLPSLGTNATGADEDLADYGLVEPLHQAVWLWAVHTLLPNEGDSEAQKLVDFEYRKIIEQVPTFYAGNAMSGGVEYIRAEGLGLELR